MGAEHRQYTMKLVIRHLKQVNNLLKDPTWTIQNLQTLEKYFATMTDRVRNELAQAVGAIHQEKGTNVETQT